MITVLRYGLWLYLTGASAIAAWETYRTKFGDGKLFSSGASWLHTAFGGLSPWSLYFCAASVGFAIGFLLYDLITVFDARRRPLDKDTSWLIGHCYDLVRNADTSNAADLEKRITLLRSRLAEFGEHFRIPAPTLNERPSHALEIATSYVLRVCLPVRNGNRRGARAAAKDVLKKSRTRNYK